MKNVDKVVNDYYYKSKSVEEAESEYQKFTINHVLTKYGIAKSNIDLLLGSDLQNQLLASSTAVKNLNIPFIGIYSACASFVSELIIAAVFTNSNMARNVIVTTSSHNLASEKQFRFPIEYGALKHKVNTFTATASVSALITRKEEKIKLNQLQ